MKIPKSPLYSILHSKGNYTARVPLIDFNLSAWSVIQQRHAHNLSHFG